LPLEHDPIASAKTIATLDHLSGGRVRLGVGFGWNLEEMIHHGVPVKRRRTMLADYLAAMGVLWRDDEAEYSGEFVSFGPSWAWPKPVQQPRPPILVGTSSTAKNFDWIAKHADGWISTPRDATFGASIALLGERWAAAGRDGRPQVAILDVTGGGQVEAIVESGADEIVVGLPDVDRDTAMRLLDTMTTRLASTVAFASD
ncbi:MAG TPA: LLM class flavin-dependent oxidoreductase, partial [Ilumatobacteraceae bacterium]|nr:LLM class flavin-dependent oxidoreductase [Ilumatobacteraceae bacterium]